MQKAYDLFSLHIGTLVVHSQLHSQCVLHRAGAGYTSSGTSTGIGQGSRAQTGTTGYGSSGATGTGATGTTGRTY